MSRSPPPTPAPGGLAEEVQHRAPLDGGPDPKRPRTENVPPPPPDGVQAAPLAPAKPPAGVPARPPEKSPPPGEKADGDAAAAGAAAPKGVNKRQRESAGYGQMPYPPFPPGVFPPGAFGAPGAMPWLGVGPLPGGSGSKKQQALMLQQQQNIALWHHHHQEYAARMALWQQQLSSQGQPSGGSKGPSALHSKMNKVKTNYNKGLMKDSDGVGASPGSTAAVQQTSMQSPSSMSSHAQPMSAGAASSRQGVGPSASSVLSRSELPDNLFPEPQYPQGESKTRKLWGRLEDAYEDPEKLEALILEILHDQPTILAAAVDSEFGQGVRQATVMRAVFEARPMLNLLVGILSKYVPADAWNREVRPMCEQLQQVFGKPGLFCGHAQGAKELKAAEMLRNPPESAVQRKGRDGRTPKGEGDGVVSMYGKRLLQSCRCDSSKCLKMYCTCFRNETRCNASCVCLECHNDGMHEEERLAAARAASFQTKKPRIDNSKLQAQVALLAAAQDTKKIEKERKKRGRAYTKAQIKIATKYVLKYESKCEEIEKNRTDGSQHNGGSMPSSEADGEIHKNRDIPRTGTFENEAVWASFCVATGEVNHRAVNLWDRVQREMKKASSSKAAPMYSQQGLASTMPSLYAQVPGPPLGRMEGGAGPSAPLLGATNPGGGRNMGLPLDAVPPPPAVGGMGGAEVGDVDRGGQIRDKHAHFDPGGSKGSASQEAPQKSMDVEVGGGAGGGGVRGNYL